MLSFLSPFHASPLLSLRYFSERRKAARRLLLEGFALLLVLFGLAFLAWSVSALLAPVSQLEQQPVMLDAALLPYYSLRTSLRMLLALAFSLLFTLVYAGLAAKNKRVGMVLVPLLDVLQSVPILGYISFTVTLFLALFPGSMLGVELAAIFAIFTSQVWNMVFSFYHSLRSTPRDVLEAARVMKFSGWQVFWRVELPYAMPPLARNMVISMAGGWFFVVASEVISVGNQKLTLPGIGSYIALAIADENITAIWQAIGAMALTIWLTDQLLFKPLLAWADKFQYDTTGSTEPPSSLVFEWMQASRLLAVIFLPLRVAAKKLANAPFFPSPTKRPLLTVTEPKSGATYLWSCLLLLLGLSAVALWVRFGSSLPWADFTQSLTYTCYTLLRVLVLVTLASLLWIPLGTLIGMNAKLANVMQPVAQFLASFPANVVFPLAVVWIAKTGANPDIWLSPLMILGTQWYILFNVIAGASAIPHDLREVSSQFSIRGATWWRRVAIPAVFPAFLTGAITASGGAWNASIVAEAVNWGNQSYTAHGIGAFIAQATLNGHFERIALGMALMVLAILGMNRLLWQPLFHYAARKLRIDS